MCFFSLSPYGILQNRKVTSFPFISYEKWRPFYSADRLRLNRLDLRIMLYLGHSFRPYCPWSMLAKGSDIPICYPESSRFSVSGWTLHFPRFSWCSPGDQKARGLLARDLKIVKEKEKITKRDFAVMVN